MNGKRRLRRDKRILANDLYNVSVDHLPPAVAKPAATSSTASAATFCYFYSQGGKRHPVAKHVMYLTQPLKSWLRALEGVVEVALEGLHISFPDIPDNMMGAVVSFLHTGIAQGDVDLQWEICTVLVEVFGFPNNMNLKKLEFNSEAYQQITNVPGINSERCEICMKGCSLREIYPHAKEHAQASLSLAYLASKSKDKTSCVFCSVDIAGGKGNAGGGIQQEIKAHHNRHLKDLAKRLNKRYKYEVMDPDLTAAAADNEGGGEASHLRIVSVSSGAKAAAAAATLSSSSSRPTTSMNVGSIPPPGGRSPRHHGLKQLATVKREPGSVNHATYQTESATAYASISTNTAAGRPCVSERQTVSGPRRASGSSRRISSSSSASSSSAAAAAATASDVTSERSCTPEERQPAATSAASATSTASSKTRTTIQNGASSASSVPSSKHQNGTNAYGRAGGKPQSLMPTTPAAAAAVPAAAVKTSQSSCGGSEGGVKRRTGPRPGPASKKKKMMLSAAAAASSPAAAAAASSTTAATAPPQPAAVNRGASFSSSAELPYFPTVSSESDEDELIFD